MDSESLSLDDALAIVLAENALKAMAEGSDRAPGVPPNKRSTGRLAGSDTNRQHVEALAAKIKADPSFPMLKETARKMYEKYHQPG